VSRRRVEWALAYTEGDRLVVLTHKYSSREEAERYLPAVQMLVPNTPPLRPVVRDVTFSEWRD
jgi:hypothetical protein